MGQSPIGLGAASDATTFAYQSADLLRITSRTGCDGVAVGVRLFDLPSGREQGWNYNESDEAFIDFQGRASNALSVEHLRIPANQDFQSDAASHLLIREAGEKDRRFDLLGPAKKAMSAKEKVAVSVLEVSDRHALVYSFSTSGSRFDGRLGAVDLMTGSVAFLSTPHAPSGAYVITRDMLYIVQSPASAPMAVDPKTMRVKATFAMPGAKRFRVEDYNPTGQDHCALKLDEPEQRLIVGCTDQPTRWYSVNSGKLLGSADAPAFQSSVRSWQGRVALTPNREHIVTFDARGFVAVADAKTGAVSLARDDDDQPADHPKEAVIRQPYSATAVLSADATRYAVSAKFGGVVRKTRLVNLLTGSVTELPVDNALAVSNTGDVLLTRKGIWDVARKQYVPDSF